MKANIKTVFILLLAVITIFCLAACVGAQGGGRDSDDIRQETPSGDIGAEQGGGDNTGSDNTGSENTGGDNTGSDNTGSENTGSDNTGAEQGGSDNTGGDNTGAEQGGSDNTGGDNTGSTGVDGDNATGADDTSTDTGEKKVLVAYFSATGNTQPLAQYAASYTGGTLYEIVPAVPYTAADLAYYTDCRADREQSDPAARPQISGAVANMAQYDIVFIGYPIWHGQAPKIIYTFLESYAFTGKTIVPFCTSASSGVGSSASNLHACAPDAVWKSGTRFAIGTSEAAVKTWIDGLGLDIKSEVDMIKVRCGDRALDIELEDNPSAKAFAKKLKDGDVTVVMDDYGGFEKVGSLGFSLVQTDTYMTTSPGDVILYQGNSITIYYGTNSWSFTRLGKIKNMTRETMLAFFGGEGQVTVTFSLK